MTNHKNFIIKLSYVEIYNELVFDLLSRGNNEQSLQIHEECKDKHFYVKGANEVQVKSIEEVLKLITIGEKNRHYAETFLNHCSSRSHTLFRLHIT